MSVLLTEATVRAVTVSGYGAITNGLGLLATGILVLLLVVQVLLGAPGGETSRRSAIFDVAAWPLLAVLLVSAALRLLQLLPGG